MSGRGGRTPGPGMVAGMTHEAHDHHDVVVGRRGAGAGTLLGIIVIALLVAGVWYVAFGPGQGSVDGGDAIGPDDVNVSLEPPSVAPDAN